MFKRNGLNRVFLYAFFISMLALLPACDKLFPPKILDLALYPQQKGYLALIQVSGKAPALLVQATDVNGLKEIMKQWETEKNVPKILVFGTLNSKLMSSLEQSGIFNQIEEFHFPEMDKRPDYLEKAISEFKAKKIKTGPLRQNRYLPLRNAELIVLAPHEYEVYDDNTRITFKLIRGRTSFILAPVIDKNLIKTLTRTYGSGGSLRADELIAVKLDQVNIEDVMKLFENPEIVLTNKEKMVSPIRFRTEGDRILRISTVPQREVIAELEND